MPRLISPDISQAYLWIPLYRMRFILRNLLGFIERLSCMSLTNFLLDYILINVYIEENPEKKLGAFLAAQ